MGGLSWDELFMSMAYLVASKSKDKRTHIGAVIVGPDNEVVSTGYNSFVRGLNDDVLERNESPEKYYWFEHAERNAIYNAVLIGASTRNCVMYTNGIPCADCARGIIQAGIKEVIVDKDWNDTNTGRWLEHSKRSMTMFDEVGVKVRLISTDLINICKFRRGEKLKNG